MTKKIPDRLVAVYRLVKQKAMRFKLPRMEDISLYDVVSFFIKGIINGAISTRAGSVAFSFFMAIFPAILFLFSVIPYVPVAGFQDQLFDILHEVMPPDSFEVARNTIEDIITNKRGGLLSFSVIATLLFSTNGTLSIISNFSITTHDIEPRAFLQQYLIAFSLTLILMFGLIIGIILLLLGESVTSFLVSEGYLAKYSAQIIQFTRYILLIVIILSSISLIFYVGPTKKREWRFFSHGSILATLLVIVSSVAFGFYINNFAQYNQLYGSIGTLLVIMLWIYINSLGLIIGFELDASILGAKKKNRRRKLAV